MITQSLYVGSYWSGSYWGGDYWGGTSIIVLTIPAPIDYTRIGLLADADIVGSVAYIAAQAAAADTPVAADPGGEIADFSFSTLAGAG